MRNAADYVIGTCSDESWNMVKEKSNTLELI